MRRRSRGPSLEAELQELERTDPAVRAAAAKLEAVKQEIIRKPLPKFNPYALVRPCTLCPFRTDVVPYLRKTRVREIERSILGGAEFPCHETTGAKSGEEMPRDKQAHCAGALILMEKNGRASQMMRIAERLGMYDARKLDMSAPVFESFAAMRKVQSR